MRKLLAATLLGLMLVLAVESVSSYILFRHYAHLHRVFSPNGSAGRELVGLLFAKAQGRRAEVDLSIDHGPLFRADPTLGYTMYPGAYQIVERQGGLSHRFLLTVDASGRRITSYRRGEAARRIFIAGDSALFGWGLDDEYTTAWLLQTRFPQFDVVNLSLTSYSTIQALFQLSGIVPAVTPDDVIVLTYHPITNTFNTAGPEMIAYLKAGFEHHLADSVLANAMIIPFGALDAAGKLEIKHATLPCGPAPTAASPCDSPPVNPGDASHVTELAFDAIMAAHPAHFVIAFLSGEDSDPVLTHLRSKGAVIVDLRMALDAPDANDEQQIDGHAGPFYAHTVAERLTDALRQLGLQTLSQAATP